MLRKAVYSSLGIVSVILGIVGIFVPGLPTTPFLLLSSWLFYRSSKRLHDILHRSSLGEYIRRYEAKGGVSKKLKCIMILAMWIMISISAFLFFETWGTRLFLFALGIIGTCCVLIFVPLGKDKL